ncbi:hypothetical protein JOL79_21260 [Microbispora sp. RL4-1S]|uniref:GNAT family N-acetyltransferase n=1 Tax=Microbispora oryzae TaxID=2806554 RepID=A0A940WSP7_9ACTN|nr:hypothetical protein [Microbispora oryzae]MBP2706341.1 hypothetical protein [Microbispora oryzae]
MEIRNGKIDDIVPIVALHVDSWRSAYAGIMPDSFLNGPLTDDRLTLWRERLASPVQGSGLFVAHDDGELLGFVYLFPAPDERHGRADMPFPAGFRAARVRVRLADELIGWMRTSGLHGTSELQMA